MVWEIVFMLLILKIPIVYLCVVVWYAIRAEPAPAEPSAAVRVDDTPPPGGSPHELRRRARRSSRPHAPRRPRPSPRPSLRARAHT